MRKRRVRCVRCTFGRGSYENGSSCRPALGNIEVEDQDLLNSFVFNHTTFRVESLREFVVDTMCSGS